MMRAPQRRLTGASCIRTNLKTARRIAWSDCSRSLPRAKTPASHHAPRTTHRAPNGSDPSSAALSGYACYGPTPGTDGTFDLYWIAVHPSAQGTGGGRQLLREVEDRVTAAGGRMLIVETSSRADYEATRRFYDRGGYREGARVRDYYAPQDDRVIYTRRFPPRPVAGGVSQQ